MPSSKPLLSIPVAVAAPSRQRLAAFVAAVFSAALAGPGEAQLAGTRFSLGPNNSCSEPCAFYVAGFSAPWLDLIGQGMVAAHVFNGQNGAPDRYVESSLFHAAHPDPDMVTTAPVGAGTTLNALSYGHMSGMIGNGPPRACVRRHLVKPENISGNVTTIDFPELNGNSARRMVIQMTTMNSFPALWAENVGVWYDPLTNRWKVFVESQASLAPLINTGAGLYVINVIDDSCDDSGLTFFAPHVASAANISGLYPNVTYLDGIAGIHDPETLLLVTQLWSSAAPVYNDHPVGLWFDPVEQLWSIYNEDRAAMPVGARFFVARIDLAFADDFERGDVAHWSSVVP